jgi:hypothetical protein
MEEALASAVVHFPERQGPITEAGCKKFCHGGLEAGGNAQRCENGAGTEMPQNARGKGLVHIPALAG